jgi:hypothetical protein
MHKPLIVALLLIASGQAAAQTTSATSLFVIGMPYKQSCGQYLSAAHNHRPGMAKGIKSPEGDLVDEHARYQDWLTGFITGTNAWKLYTGDGKNIETDPAAIDVWMRKWCEQNPTKSVVEAAVAFVLEQGK